MEGEQQQNNTPIRCANGCGFFGYHYEYIFILSISRNPLTGNMCSKCWKDKEPVQKKSTPVETPKQEVVSEQPLGIQPHIYDTYDLVAPIPEKPKELQETKNTPAPPSAEGDQNTDDGNEKNVQKDTSKCWTCKKKVGLLGFRCRCDL